MSGSRRWFLAVPLALLVTGLLAFLTTCTVAGGIQSDLAARARTALGAKGLPTEGVRFQGRDATITGLPAGQANRAADVVRGVAGVRTVDVETPLADRSTDARDPEQRVQAALDRVLRTSPITFHPETDELTPQATQAMSEVVEVMRTAPNSIRFEIAGHVAHVPGGDPESALELSEARAQAVARQLNAAGIEHHRLRPVGYGDTRPRPGGDPPTSNDRRVEITVE